MKQRNSFLGRATFALVAMCLPAFASGSKPDPLAFAERIWGMQDGLPEQVVQAFAQTNDRYLWIGTTGGLLRSMGLALFCTTAKTLQLLPTTISFA